MRGCSASVAAIARRCFSPPESVLGSRCSKPARPTVCQRLRDAAAHLVRRHAELLHAEGDLLQHVGGEELRLEVLRDQADDAGQVGDPFVLRAGVP